jgi:antirestriction protein
MGEKPRQPGDGQQSEPGDDERLAAERLPRIDEPGARTLGELATTYSGEEAEAEVGAGSAVPGDWVGGAPELDSPGIPDGQPERDDAPHPRIYVASLGDLLVGSAHGVWLDAAKEPGELEARIVEMLASSPWATDQWAIHEVDGFFSLQLSGFEDIGRVSRLAQGLQAQGEALARWVGYLGTAHLDEALATFEQSYRGHFGSLMAYVEHLSRTDQFVRNVPALPRHMLPRGLQMVAATLPETAAELYIVEGQDGGIHVFDASEGA